MFYLWFIFVDAIKNLTSRVERLEKQYDTLLEQYFALASSKPPEQSPALLNEPEQSPVLLKSSQQTPILVDKPKILYPQQSCSPLLPRSLTTGSFNSSPCTTPPGTNVLLDPDDVIRKYPKLLNLSNIGRLSVRLAQEAYFGTEMMERCTVLGCNNKPPLPRDKVFQLKSKVLSLFPQFISAPLEFEPQWSKCIGAINHSARGLSIKKLQSQAVITL